MLTSEEKIKRLERRLEALKKGLKICHMCKQMLAYEEFNKDRSSHHPDGLNDACRECMKDYKRRHKAERVLFN